MNTVNKQQKLSTTDKAGVSFNPLFSAVAWRKFFIRLTVCWKILSKTYRHWVILSVDEPNLIKLLQNKEFTVGLDYHGVQPYVVRRMIQMVSNEKDDTDMLLDKISFEVEAEERYGKR